MIETAVKRMHITCPFWEEEIYDFRLRSLLSNPNRYQV